MIYSRDVRINKRTAIIILLVEFFQATGLMGAIGLNLQTTTFGGIPLFTFILTLGNLWIVYGLYKGTITGVG